MTEPFYEVVLKAGLGEMVAVEREQRVSEHVPLN
jgi:hypothetical protein